MRGSLPGNTIPLETEQIRVRKEITADPGEMQYLMDRSFVCPVCGKRFNSKCINSSKAELEGWDTDLRPRYKGVDVSKYRVAECLSCGYAGIARYDSKIGEQEKTAYKESGLKTLGGSDGNEGLRSYRGAYDGYRAALRCYIINNASHSVRGLTALYTAWLLRGWREALEKEGETVEVRDAMSLLAETRLLRYALYNFKRSELEESDALSDIGENVLNYIIAALSYMQGEYQVAEAYLRGILNSTEVRLRLFKQAKELHRLIRTSRRLDRQERQERPDRQEKDKKKIHGRAKA